MTIRKKKRINIKHYKKHIPYCSSCGNKMQKRLTLRNNQKRYFCDQCGNEQN